MRINVDKDAILNASDSELASLRSFGVDVDAIIQEASDEKIRSEVSSLVEAMDDAKSIFLENVVTEFETTFKAELENVALSQGLIFKGDFHWDVENGTPHMEIKINRLSHRALKRSGNSGTRTR